MNKKLLTVLAVGSLITAINTSVFAEDTGRVEFSGRIVADTCVIGVDDAGANTVVAFADAYPGDFDGDGTLGLTRDFWISLAKYGPTIASLNLGLSGGTTDSESLRLKNNLSDVNTVANVGTTITDNNGGSTDVVFNDSVPISTTDVVNTDDKAIPSVFSHTVKVIQIGDEKPTIDKCHASANFIVFCR